jgi:Integrase core domain
VQCSGAGGSAVPLIVEALAKGEAVWAHSFEYACAQLGIERRWTKPKHPWTNGQVERMNRTIKEATVKRYHYDTHGQLERHLADFVSAYNYGRRLKTLSGLTPYEFICKRWTIEPENFRLNPIHQMPGLNSSPHFYGVGPGERARNPVDRLHHLKTDYDHFDRLGRWMQREPFEAAGGMKRHKEALAFSIDGASQIEHAVHCHGKHV